MFERMKERVGAMAERRVRELVPEVAERARERLPAGVSAEAEEGGVRLSGKGLQRRLALDPALRWLWLRLL